MRSMAGAFSRYRPRVMTLIVLIVVAAPTTLANLSPGDFGSISNLSAPKVEYGWPFTWYWREFKFGFPLQLNLSQWSWPRLAGNLAMWLVMLAIAGGTCEWLLRRYRPRLRWSLQTMLLAMGLLAVLFAWFTAVRNRANMQDPIIAAIEKQYGGVYLERWGPKWLDLVGADRFRRRVFGAKLPFGDAPSHEELLESLNDAEELLKRVRRLPDLRYLDLDVKELAPGMAAALADMRQLRMLRFWRYDGISKECVAAIGKLAELEELHLKGNGIDSESLMCLAGLTNLRSFSLDINCEGRQRNGEPVVLAHLPALPRLEAIDLRSSSDWVGCWGHGKQLMFGDQELRHLAVLPSVKSLNLSETNVTDSGLAELGSLESLEELAINNKMVSAAGLQSLIGLKCLKALHIDPDGDESDRPATLALDHGDELSVSESEVAGLRRAFDALRQSNPGIVIDSDTTSLDERRKWQGQRIPDDPPPTDRSKPRMFFAGP